MWIHSDGSSTILECKIHPNAKKDSIDGIKDNMLCVHLSAPPVEGKANKALVKYISKRLHIAKSKISITHGEKSRIKVLCLDGIGPEEVLSGLGLTQ
ncbi:MAG: DUF167 domain-containing protein [Deltaproteobacteria bacterium]|nr:DUF167 domain-containing protein [Deltaproteobacteria bacterium]